MDAQKVAYRKISGESISFNVAERFANGGFSVGLKRVAYKFREAGTKSCLSNLAGKERNKLQAKTCPISPQCFVQRKMREEKPVQSYFSLMSINSICSGFCYCGGSSGKG